MAKRGPKGPHKYSPQYVSDLADKIKVFLEKCESAGIFPTKTRFCTENGITRETIKYFLEKTATFKSEKLSYALKLFEECQETNLVEGALSGKYQPTFSIFTAKNVLGWRDEQYIKHDGMNNIFNILLTENIKAATSPKNRMLQSAD